MSEAPLLGRPVWYELLTSDLHAAEAFYTKVVGWTSAPFAGADPPYTLMHRAGDVPVAGMMGIPDGMSFPPHWEMYVATPALDDTVGNVARLGGTALGPLVEVPTVGRMQTMQDPQGAVFALLEPSGGPGAPEAAPVDGDVAWHELYATDVAAALGFYSTLFGWRATEAMDMGAMGTYQMFGRGRTLGGMMRKMPEMADVPCYWNLYFQVPAIGSGVERVKAHGGQVLHGPMQVPGGGWVAICLDPQGAAFSLFANA